MPEALLEQFVATTFFTRKEILKYFSVWEGLGGRIDASIAASTIAKIPEIRYNPFRHRICRIFGSKTFKLVPKDASEEKLKEEGEEDEKEQPSKKDNKEIDGVAEKKNVDEETAEYVLSFQNFITMLNAFSPRASLQVKAFYAFKLYDVDSDYFISTEDIVKTIEMGIGVGMMTSEQLHQVASAVLHEADIDGTNRISQTEFFRLIKRIPEFASRFQFSLA
eukprot:CAMPEP_0175126112 /NCGR_PEP_ID=MMETSP0087-20121206/3672_1 /TAXON_ID=136419 /ORGANISM="Unknown Unknown, Strain D1" /LENGTH=220 /DNA_ID=CAMNT_0016407987 /DNA_START=49 /DNA_END=711 /DNA_ORIENTATION=+